MGFIRDSSPKQPLAKARQLGLVESVNRIRAATAARRKAEVDAASFAANKPVREAAAQAAAQAGSIAAHNAAVGAASDALAVPQAQGDVLLNGAGQGQDSASANTFRKRRVSFGSDSGVNI